MRTVRPHAIGRTIVRAEFRSRFVTPGDRDQLAVQLAGSRILDVRRRGKFIVFELSQGTLSVHLGMTGRLITSGEVGVHTHGVLELDQGVLVYDDIRQFGRIEFFGPQGGRAEQLGPEPLELTAQVFVERLRKRVSRIKPLLLNQKFLAGLGNIYVDESLFRAGIHPLAFANRVSRERALKLHEAIVGTLEESIAFGGSSISDYVDAEGRRGGFQLLHRVYGREGNPCLACGTPVKRIVVGQRGTHFCPRCQKR